LSKEQSYKKIHFTRIMRGEKEKEEVSDIIVQESFLSVVLNKEKVITLKCSPEDYDYLGIGFLYTSGILQKKEDINSIVVDEEQKMIKIKVKNIYSHLESSWRDGLISRRSNRIDEKLISELLLVKHFLKVESGIIFSLMHAMQKRAKLFKLTGGVHSCALANQQGSIMLFSEDISRYNTIDKILGEALLKNISREDKIILTSCRITSDILTKIAMGRVPIIISRAAPTDWAVELAQKIGITLVGFVRGKRMNIYTHPERIEV